MDKLTGGTLTPAYGRDYKSAKDALADLKAGKDFVFHGMSGEGYVSISDLDGFFTVRYAKIRKVVGVKVKDGKVV